MELSDFLTIGQKHFMDDKEAVKAEDLFHSKFRFLGGFQTQPVRDMF